MNPQIHTPNTLEYSTQELKLAALLVSEIPKALIEVFEQGNSDRKIIQISYPIAYKEDVDRLVKAFINKSAITNIYTYNRALNLIRDRLRGKDGSESANRKRAY